MSNSSAGQDLQVVENAAALPEAVAPLVQRAAEEAIDQRGTFCVALAGGSTPKPLYERLAQPPFRDGIDWSRTQVFFSDERFVPPDSPDSNFRMANEALLSKVPISDRFVHRFATVDLSPEESATLYAEGIRRVLQASLTEIPRFDLILLGLGPDGHTASLFPGTEALSAVGETVVPNFVPKLDAWRLTFTFTLLNAAHRVAFLVAGEDKASAVAGALDGEGDLPAAQVRPTRGELFWFLDRAAASELPAGSSTGLTREETQPRRDEGSRPAR